MRTASAEQLQDRERVARCLRGEPGAFDEIVAAHRWEVYRVARRILGNHEDAAEATQEAFVRAWKGLRRFRGEAQLRTWLVRIALHSALSLRARRDGQQPLPDAGQAPEASGGAEEELLRRERETRLRLAVAELPPRQQQVVWMKIFAEMSHAEVAAVMGLSEGAVKAHLHQAVANLRRRLGGREGGAV